MTILENMPDGMIPFPPGHVVVLYFLANIKTTATLSSLLIINAIYKAGPYQDSKFILSLCIADLLFSAHSLILTSLNIHYGAFSIGKTGCAISAGFIFVTAAAAILSVAAMAINMYLVLIRRVYMSDWQKDGLIIGLWICLISLAASFLSTDYRFKGIAVAAAGDYCFLAFSSSDPLQLLADAAVIFSLVAAFSIITYVYATIYLMYNKTAGKKAKKSKKNEVEFTSNQKKLFLKAIAVCGAFIVCWFPQLMVFVLEITTHRQVSYGTGLAADIASNMTGIVNAIVLYRHDKRIKREINSLISDFLTKIGLEFYLQSPRSPGSLTSTPEMNRKASPDQCQSLNIELGALNFDRAIITTTARELTTVKM